MEELAGDVVLQPNLKKFFPLPIAAVFTSEYGVFGIRRVFY
jgi:hypothetical protein